MLRPSRGRSTSASDPDIPGRNRDGVHDRARSAARRHGRGNAPRRRRLRHGRGSRRIPGRLQDHAGPAPGIRRQARHRHADHRARLCRRRRRRGDGGSEADRRVHDLQLRHAGDRPDHQFGGEDALHVGRTDGRADRLPRPERRRRPRRRPALPVLRGMVQPCAGAEGGDALYGGRRQGPAQGGDPRPEPGDLPRERDPLRPFLRRAEDRRFRPADRQGARPQDRQGRHHRLLRHRHDLCDEGGRGTGRHGDRLRNHRSEHDPADGPADRDRNR